MYSYSHVNTCILNLRNTHIYLYLFFNVEISFFFSKNTVNYHFTFFDLGQNYQELCITGTCISFIKRKQNIY